MNISSNPSKITRNFFAFFVICISLIFLLNFHLLNSSEHKKNKISKDKTQSKIQNEDLKLDSIIDYLLTESAKDFSKNQNPLPIKFKNVRVKNLKSNNSDNNFMLCGEFLCSDNSNKNKWTKFATIKTREIEQWIGSLAEGYCKDASDVKYTKYDLSSELLSRMNKMIQNK